MRAAQAPKGILKSLQEDGVFKKDEMLDTVDVADFMEEWKGVIEQRQDTGGREFDIYEGDFSFNEDGSLPKEYKLSFCTTLETYKQSIINGTKEQGKFHLHFIAHDQFRKHFTRLEIIISTQQQKGHPNQITNVEIKHIDSNYSWNEEKKLDYDKFNLLKMGEKHAAIHNAVDAIFGANITKHVSYEDRKEQQKNTYECGHIVLHDILSSLGVKDLDTTDKIRLEIAKKLFQQEQQKKNTAVVAAASSPGSIELGQIKIAKPEDVEKYKELRIEEGDLIDTTVLEVKAKAASAAPIHPAAPAASASGAPTPAAPTAVTATATLSDKEFDKLEDAEKINLITQAFQEAKKKIDCSTPKKQFEISEDAGNKQISITGNTCEIYLTHTYYDSATNSEKTSEVILKRTATLKDATKPGSRDIVEWTCTSKELSQSEKYQLIAVQIFEMRAANQNALKKSGIQHHEIEVLPLDGKAPTNASSTKGDIDKLADPKEKMVIQAFFKAGFTKVVYCGQYFDNPAVLVSTRDVGLFPRPPTTPPTTPPSPHHHH